MSGWRNTPGKPRRYSRKAPAHPMTREQERAFLAAAAVASRCGAVTQCPTRFADGGGGERTRAGTGHIYPRADRAEVAERR